jgi:hypothetical protein
MSLYEWQIKGLVCTPRSGSGEECAQFVRLGSALWAKEGKIKWREGGTLFRVFCKVCGSDWFQKSWRKQFFESVRQVCGSA